MMYKIPMAALSTGMHAYCCLLYSWCELCGFIREINSGISHVRYHFFPAGTTFIFHSTRMYLRAMILTGTAGRICHPENVKSYMSYLQQCTNIIKMLTRKACFS
jgi:hypothetical protein